MASSPTATTAPASASLAPTPTTALNIQTTPFHIPTSCPYGWDWSTSLETNGPSDLQIITTHTSIIMHPTSARGFCMPSNWNSAAGFEFWPGVCPHAWTAYNLATTSLAASEVVTTAFCCPSGYTPTAGTLLSPPQPTGCAQFIPFNSPPLNLEIIRQPSRANSGPSTSTFSHGLALQPAWHVTWGSSDIATLLPTPPPLPDGTTIAAWTPPLLAAEPTASSRSSARSVNWDDYAATAWPVPTIPSSNSAATSSPNCIIKSDQYGTGCLPQHIIISIFVPVSLLIAGLALWCACWTRRVRRRNVAEASRKSEGAGLPMGNAELGAAQGLGLRRSGTVGMEEGRGEEGDADAVLPKYVKVEDVPVEAPPAYTPPAKKMEG